MARLDKDVDYDRLCTAIRVSRRTLERYRVERLLMVRELAGGHYGPYGVSYQGGVPVNILALYRQIVGRKLISNDEIRVNYSTFNKDAKPMAMAMQRWANREFKTMGFSRTMGAVVDDALFSVGVTKVCLADPSDAAMSGYARKAGDVMVSRVDLDDFAFDVGARSFSECWWMGHRYRAPLETVRDSKLYGKMRKKLDAERQHDYNEQGDDKIGLIGRGQFGYQDAIDYVELWEIYIPSLKLIVVLPSEDGSPAMDANSDPLRVFQWIGPDCGPYHILGFEPVPGNIMPKGPMQNIIDHHLSMNKNWRKAMRQSERSKDLTVYNKSAGEDAQAINNASDGDTIGLNNVQNIGKMTSGGVNPVNFEFAKGQWDQASRQAGNLELLGGLSAQAKTLGQDKMLNENSSSQVSDMQAQTIAYVSQIQWSVGWFWWHHPKLVAKSTYEVQGLPEYSAEEQVTPLDRMKVPFGDIDIQVDPYTLPHQTPAEKQQILDAIVTQLTPLTPILQQQGLMFDANFYLQKKAEYNNMPDLVQLYTVQEPPQQEDQSSTGGDTLPSENGGEYVRRSVGADTQANRENDLSNVMKSTAGSQGVQPMAQAG